MRLFAVSAMRKPPSGVTTTLFGEWSAAATAGPPSPE
jgi:hypothetical protein